MVRSSRPVVALPVALFHATNTGKGVLHLDEPRGSAPEGTESFSSLPQKERKDNAHIL
jgi:hypothetical protein